MNSIPEVVGAYTQAEKNCGLKRGDKVRITRKAGDHEWGWNNTWIDEMTHYVGTVGEVVSVSDIGIGVHLIVRSKEGKEKRHYFPYFVLEKEEVKFKPFDKVLVRNKTNEKWNAALFSHYSETYGREVFITANGSQWNYCIPFESNEYLCGTDV